MLQGPSRICGYYGKGSPRRRKPQRAVRSCDEVMAGGDGRGVSAAVKGVAWGQKESCRERTLRKTVRMGEAMLECGINSSPVGL